VLIFALELSFYICLLSIRYFLLSSNQYRKVILLVMTNNLQESAHYLRQMCLPPQAVAVVLGTGLGDQFMSLLEVESEIPYADIPHFPLSTVQGHRGTLVVARLGNKPVVVMRGRFHYYEGYSVRQVTYPVQVLAALGITHLLLTNAAGNLRADWHKGQLMLVDDHIYLLPDHPLKGQAYPRAGQTYAPYHPQINSVLMDVAHQLGIDLHKGVYAAMPGPMLETRAEQRFLQRIGADVVGMSTVPEAMVAHALGIPCAAISALTNDCSPDHLQPVSLEEILDTASLAAEPLSRLLAGGIQALNGDAISHFH
jgi:purine-nucleoside phosphorylase